MELVTQVQILDKAVSVSLHSGKGMNPSLLHTTIRRIVRETGLFNLCMRTGVGEGNWI